MSHLPLCFLLFALSSPDGSLHAAVEAELLEKMLHMPLDGAVRNLELARNHLVRQPLRDVAEQ